MAKTAEKSSRQREAKMAIAQMRHLLTAVRGLLEQRLGPHSVSVAQLHALKQIRHGTGLTGASLARVCSVTPQTMQALLVRSEREGLVERGRDPDNERLVLWSLTPAGNRLLEQGEVAFAELMDQLWRGIPRARLRELNELLGSCLENLGDRHP